MSRFVKTRIRPCRCGHAPQARGDSCIHLCWIECPVCGNRTYPCGTFTRAVGVWNLKEERAERDAKRMEEDAKRMEEVVSDLPTEPLEGRKDCRHYVGFVGVIYGKEEPLPTEHGVMHCAFHEYLNAICGVKSPIGGILTDRCERCKHYEPKEKEE